MLDSCKCSYFVYQDADALWLFCYDKIIALPRVQKKQILALSATEKRVYIKNTSVCDIGAPRPRGS